MTNEEFDGDPLSLPTPEEMCERYRAGYEELAESIRRLNEKAKGLGYEGIWSAMHALSELRAKAESRAIDVPDGWKLVPAEIIDRFPEINPSNYGHDDVCNLNAWGVELLLAAAPEAPK